ncbi:MAG: hypothetical protein QM817_38510 [Archangium sp.]
MNEYFEKLRGIILPRLVSEHATLVHEFPDLKIAILDTEIGKRTDYRGYLLGLDCAFDGPDQNSLVLDVSVRNFREARAQVDSADVSWGHPNAVVELELFSAPVPLDEESLDVIASGLDRLLTEFRASARRGCPRH